MPISRCASPAPTWTTWCSFRRATRRSPPRAKKASGLSAVVVQWNRSRKRYQRQGLLVEEPALEQAEQQCLADEDARMRRRERDRERRADWGVKLQGH